LAIKLVVGLGNPGTKYAGTRHNVGFMLVDKLAEEAGLRWQDHKGSPGQLARGASFWLAKPMTFMNDSGDFVQPLCHFFKIKPDELLVVFDDVALPLGKIRMRGSGSAGGQNGMKSVIQRMGTDAVPRLRIGIGPQPPVDSADYVLANFNSSQKQQLPEVLDLAAAAVHEAAENGLEAAMNRYNSAEAA
jgi:PTH1 family peptidyl-tRNA hydrolase